MVGWRDSKANVSLDIPGRSEPATGRLISIPERQMPLISGLTKIEVSCNSSDNYG